MEICVIRPLIFPLTEDCGGPDELFCFVYIVDGGTCLTVEVTMDRAQSFFLKRPTMLLKYLII